MTSQYTFMCGFECCISAKSIHSSLLTWRYHNLKQLKDVSHNAQNIRSGEISSHIFETYNKAAWTHGFHIYVTAENMSMAKIYPCTSKHHGIPNWKCVFCCCDEFPIIFLPSKEANKDTTNTCPTIIFHVYCNISRCTFHGWRPYYEHTTLSLFSTVLISDRTDKVYTQNNLCW